MWEPELDTPLHELLHGYNDTLWPFISFSIYMYIVRTYIQLDGIPGYMHMDVLSEVCFEI